MTTPQKYNAWVFAPRQAPEVRLRLFCFHHAGGGALSFRSWSNQLPSEIEICPVQLPGRENRLREPLFRDYTRLIDVLEEVLEPYFTQPFAFFGHSMGALLSFGLASRLYQAQKPLPLHLFLSAYRAPQTLSQDEQLHTLSDQALVEKLLGFHGTPRALLENAEMRELLLPIFRADFAVCESYDSSFNRLLPCPLSVFGGSQDARVPHDLLGPWSAFTQGPFRQFILPGDHFFPYTSGTEQLLHFINDTLQPLLVGARS